MFKVQMKKMKSINAEESELEDLEPSKFLVPEEELTQYEQPASSSSIVPKEQTLAKRSMMKRGEPWGIFSISPIYRDGVHVAWEALCRCHNNLGDKLGSSCKKSIARAKSAAAICRWAGPCLHILPKVCLKLSLMSRLGCAGDFLMVSLDAATRA